MYAYGPKILIHTAVSIKESNEDAESFNCDVLEDVRNISNADKSAGYYIAFPVLKARVFIADHWKMFKIIIGLTLTSGTRSSIQ